jgi:DNA-binding response OmpR family regulator
MAKVLLIEDDRTMQMLLTTLLQLEGFEVYSSPDDSQESLLAAIRQYHPDLTLLDVNLRQGNGIDLIQIIRADPELKELRVLMSSGLNYKEECLKAGADNFLLKPYMPDDLIKSIKNLIGHNHSG